VAKQIEKIFSNLQMGIRVYIKLLMIIGLRLVAISAAKNLIAKSKIFPTTTLTDSL
jgi:hypothetical protein